MNSRLLRRSESPLTREATAAVIVLAKAPRPGHVKTRLQSRFSPAEAAALARASLLDTLDVVQRLDVARRILALEGQPGPWAPLGFDVIAQVPGDLAVRIDAAMDHALTGAGPVLLIGMDTPQLTPELLDVDWRGADAVLGLSEDGGYWALGLREPHLAAARGVPMSQPDTGERQLARLRALGLRVRMLPVLQDVDTPQDAASVARAAQQTRFARLHARLSAQHLALELYDAALEGADVRVEGRQARPFDVRRWRGEPDEVDLMVLDRCEAPVLDVGCGPGRLVGRLASQGVPALGIDVSPRAVALTEARGAAVLRRPVQGRLPGEGCWGTVLLIDGNVGIGGDPDRLLRRCATLLRPGGLLVVEADPDDSVDDAEPVVLVAGDGRRSQPLPWARLGAASLIARAAGAGLDVARELRLAGRVFLEMHARQ